MAIAAAIFVGGVVAAPTASAHATVVSTDPADGVVLSTAPDHVSITYDEAVELQSGALRVFAPDGSRADSGSATHVGTQSNSATVSLHSGLENGTYTVSWRVVSADSHPVHGAFTFSIGDASTPAGAAVTAASGGSTTVGVLFGAARWTAYLGFALLAGSAALLLAFAPKLARDQRARRVLAGGWFALLLGTIAALLLQGPYGAGLGLGRAFDADVIRATLHTRLGQALAWRLVLLGVAGLLVSWIAARLATADAKTRQVAGIGGIGLATALAATWAAADHSGTGRQVALALPADILHLLAMAAWIGGLAMLTAVVLRSTELSDGERTTAVNRFSTLAFCCVAVLAATGVYEGWRQVGTLSALTGTSYGRILLVKVSCFAAVIALGWYARRELAARAAARAAAGTAAGTPASAGPADLRTLRRSVAAEFGIALAILAVTALLVESQPAREATAAPVNASVPFDTGSAGGSGTVNVIVDPAKVGPDTIHVYILGANGQQEAVPEVDMALSLPARQLGPLTVKLDNTGPGHYTGSNATIPFAGAWQVIVTVRTTAVDEATVIVNAQVK